MSSAAIQFGYVDPDGNNQTAIISPAIQDDGNPLASDCITAFNSFGVTAAWVDGDPSDTVSAIATQLAVPLGAPAGWLGSQQNASQPQQARMNRVQRRSVSKHKCHWQFKSASPKLGGTSVKGRQYACSCGASKIVGG